MKENEIRADYDRDTIVVYQAYNAEIALPAVKDNKFSAPFSLTRMTWIKPSFLWLMERSNYGKKPGQEFTLAIRIKRSAWEFALSQGVLTHPDAATHKNSAAWADSFEKAKVHVQWDPERSLRGAKMENRSIQVGISRHLIEVYNNEWIVEIQDYSPLVRKIQEFRKAGNFDRARKLLPNEKVYEVPAEIKKRLAMD